jgi:hypothetical protein
MANIPPEHTESKPAKGRKKVCQNEEKWIEIALGCHS